MKMFSSFIVCMLLSLHCGFYADDMENAKNQNSPVSFEGAIMISEDFGKTWQTRTSDLPDDFTAASVHTAGNYLYAGSSFGELYTLQYPDFTTAVKENTISALLSLKPKDFHRVSAMFTCPSGQYIYTDGTGLFHKKIGTSFWQPINTPDGNFHFSEIREDEKGNLYLVARTGVYRSDNYGASWEKIFHYGFAHNLIAGKDSLWVNGIQGLYLSVDEGKSWVMNQSITRMTGDHANSNSWFFEENNNLYFLKKRVYSPYNTDTGNILLLSKDKGESWQKHPANAFLKNQDDLFSLLFYKDTLFFTTRQGLMSLSADGRILTRIITFPDKEGKYACKVVRVGDTLVCVKIMAGC